MKKLLIIAVLLICILTAVLLGTGGIFGTIGEDGYAVPAGSGILQGLASGDGDPVLLVSVEYEDTVFRDIAGYYVGEERDRIDISFPLFVNSGMGLRFFDEENWLITPDVELYQTFDGLYVSEGISYNIDMTRADDEEFIFLSLGNGIYMNVQSAVFQNAEGKHSIPANSILSMKEDGITWYQVKEGTLGLFSQSIVFEATMTVGSHTYDYDDLIRALGLVQEAIEGGKPNRPDPEKLQDAEDILKPKPNQGGGGDKDDTDNPGELNPEMGENAPPEDDDSTLPTDPAGSDTTPTKPGNDGKPDGDPDGGQDSTTKPTDPEDEGTTGPAGDKPEGGKDDPGSETEGGSESHPGEGEGNIPGEENNPGGDHDPGESTPSGNPGTPEGNDPNAPSGDPSEPDHKPGEDVDTPGDGGDVEGGGDSDNDDHDPDQTEKPGGDPDPGEGAGGDGGDSGENEGDTGDDEDTEDKLTPVRLQLSAMKVLDGNAPDDNKFSFRLSDGNGVLQTKRNKGSVVAFDAIVLDKEGAYSFAISEVAGTDETIEYDNTVYIVSVVVTKNGNKLEAAIKLLKNDAAYEGVILFSNTTKTPDETEPDETEPDNGETGETGDETGETGDETGGSTVDNTGSSSEGKEDPDQTSPEASSDPDGSTGEAGDGEGVPPTYRNPVVTLSDFDLWSYAIDLNVKVNDPSSAISRGVRFAVYSKLKGSSSDYVMVDGFKTYSYENHEATGLKLRKTVNGTQDFSLNPIEPGSTVYIQFTYRYYEEVPRVDENGDPVLDEFGHQLKDSIRRNFYSDFIEIEMPTVQEAEVQPVAVDWSTPFAAYADAMGLEALAVANTSDYDEALAALTYDFENFKLNTLPYVTRLELTMRPTNGGDTVTLAVGSSVLSRAQKGTVEYRTTNPKLASNTTYVCTVRLLDRYGNALPALFNGEDGSTYSQLVYTQKKKPSVTITEVENITDSLTLKIHVSDPDAALVDGQSLIFSMQDSSGNYAALDGTWDLDKISDGGADVKQLELKDAKDGATYTLTMDSLPFSRLFTARVMGDYLPQPDGETPDTLDPITDTQFGTVQIYTASLSSGLVSFITSFSGIRDNEATLNLTMSGNTTVDILPLVDEYRVTLTDPNGKVITKTVLNYEALSQPGCVEYANNRFTLEPGDFVNPVVELYGAEDRVRNNNPWDSFNIAYQDNGDGELELTTPMQLRVIIPPDGGLTNFTKYRMTVEAVVIKGGEEYFIPVSVTNAQFTTKKTIPVIEAQDLFVAADVAQFVGLTIQDPDSTILNGGAVTAQLYYGTTLLSVKNVQADQTPDSSGDPITLEFTGLIAGGKYTVKFVAGAYNDEEGYGAYRTNHILKEYDITGGENLMGSLTLEALYDSRGTVSGKDAAAVVKGLVASSTNTAYKHSSYTLMMLPCSPNTTYDLSYTSNSGYVYLATANTTVEAIQGILNGGPNVATTYKSGTNQTGSCYRKFTTGPNDNFVLVSFNHSQLETIQGSLRISATGDSAERIPSGTYDAGIRVNVSDLKGYLGREDGNKRVKVVVERSESISLPSYTEYSRQYLELSDDGLGKGGLAVNELIDLTSLPGGNAWRVTLSCVYDGREIRLSQISFQTDSGYISVSTHLELIRAVTANPYANILVTSDFVLDQNSSVSPRGTIDFQGHVITMDGNKFQTYMFGTIYDGAVVKNLVVDFPRVANYTYTRLINNISGTVENIILRTYTSSVNKTSTDSMLCYQVTQTGVLRNFIVQLGGDVTIVNNDGSIYNGIVFGINYGTVEDGYVFSQNGAGIIGCGTGKSAIFGWSRVNGIVRNCYVVADRWLRSGTENYYIAHSSGGRGKFNDVYLVGDAYSVGADGTKSYLLPLTSASMSSSAATYFQNTWVITARELDTGSFNNAGVDKLYDLDWQIETLGSAFDVEGTIKMGFYPRLYLPTEMQKYQVYLPLPVQDDSTTPEIVSDVWASEEEFGEPGLSEGYVLLRLRNDAGYKITDILIDNLVTTIVRQEAADDGMYDLILKVGVDPRNENYVSSYTVTALSYNNGSSNRTTKPDYKTTSVEFWKSVANTGEWRMINQNMKWNYKLVADINFQDAKPGEIVINGSLDNFTATTAFTGKIDGDEHILSNITMNNITNPYVIYYVNGGQVKNLLIDNMEISSSNRPRYTNSGFIAYASGGELNNIRIRNSSITAGANVGLVLGNCSNTRIINCSAVDSTISDIEAGYSVWVGGIVGYTPGSLTHCYTRNVTMNIVNAASISGVGGIAGFGTSTALTDCYSHGTITTAGANVGGIYGNVTTGDSSYIMECVSYVKIRQVAGDYAGGLGGFVYGAYNSIALGDVSSPGGHVGRIAGGLRTSNPTTAYAWAEQKVTGTAEGTLGNASYLLTTEQLQRASVWQDVVRLGADWNYEPVTRGYLPLLNAEWDCANPEWQQKEIPLPGSGNDPKLSIIAAQYDANASDGYPYTMMAEIAHPGVTHEQFMQWYADGSATVALEGMDLTEAAVEQGKTKIVITGSENKTHITIQTKDFLQAKDSYELQIVYTDSIAERKLAELVTYMEKDGVTPHINWWYVSDLSEWNAVVEQHGLTNENIMITGTVDFGHATTIYQELIINRLQGEHSGNGFVNLDYRGALTGNPWIEKISMELRSITFDNCLFDFSMVNTSRPRSGPILFAGNVYDLSLYNISFSFNSNSRGGSGFICNTTGIIDGVAMKNILMKDVTPTSGSTPSNAGALIASTNNSVMNVTAENISIDMPKVTRVGAVIGYQTEYGKSLKEIHITGVDVKGYSYVGPLAGHCTTTPTSCSVTGTEAMHTSHATNGVVGGMAGYAGSTNQSKDLIITNMTVLADKGSAGGYIGGSLHPNLDNLQVLNCTITGTTTVGGAIGGKHGTTNASVNLKNIQIVNCVIVNTGAAGADDHLSVATGGVMSGLWVENQSPYITGVTVRNTSITGNCNVGGVIGVSFRVAVSNGYIRNVYIAEDVTITGSSINARSIGGIIGWANRANIQDVIVGATINCEGTAAGGIIGHIETQEGAVLEVKLSKAMYLGTLTAATDYAGGIVGKLNSSIAVFTDSTLVNCVVAASVNSHGNNTSLWVNDTSLNASAGQGTVYICEDSLLQGQTAKELMEASKVMDRNLFIIPETVKTGLELLRPAEDFNDRTFYKNTLELTGRWDYSHIGETDENGQLNVYMPYTKNATDNGILPNANTKGGASAGILVPEVNPPQGRISVYPSGVNTINIEVPVIAGTTDNTVTVNGVEYPVDENGVVSLYYNYTDSFTIGDVTYHAIDLTRRVMAYGGYWYVIESDGTVTYGTDSSVSRASWTVGTVAGVANAKHLWQGRVVTEDGTIYQLLGETVAADSEVSKPHLTKTNVPNPLWTEGMVKTYHTFSLLGTNRVEYQVVRMADTPYTISQAQNTVADGVILTRVGSDNDEKRYFATLGQDGTLTAWLSTMRLGTAANEGIHHISNTFGYSGTVMGICYDSGAIVVVDYITGEKLYTTVEQTFLTYAAESVTTMFQPMGGTILPGNEEFPDKDETPDTTEGYEAEKPTEPEQTLPPVPGTNTEEGTAGEAGSVIPDTTEGTEPEGVLNGGGGVSLEEGDAMVPGEEYTGDGGYASEDGQLPGTDADGEGNDEIIDTTEPEEEKTGGAPGGGEGTGDGQEQESGPSGGTLDPQNGSGGDGSGGDGTGFGSGDGTGGDGSIYADGSSAEAILGSAVPVYNPATGGYVNIPSEEFVNGTANSAATPGVRAPVKEQAEQPVDAAPEKEAGKLDVAHGIDRDLYAQEKQGFWMVGFTTAAGLLALVLLMNKAKRKKK